MLIKTYAGLKAQGREKVVANGSARTMRFLTQADRLGFTISDVHLKAGAENVLWYKNHWEANYVIAGRGEVKDLGTGAVYVLEPGVMYIVGPKDRHGMKVITDMHLISVFNPALQGDEQHDAEGTLAPSGPLPPGPPAA
ncbi:MAG: L-ectoine synthase [Alphaproteobacteria bacterium]|nr:L-ectoine synthase [Alphaproteobacteria bacterium]